MLIEQSKKYAMYIFRSLGEHHESWRALHGVSTKGSSRNRSSRSVKTECLCPEKLGIRYGMAWRVTVPASDLSTFHVRGRTTWWRLRLYCTVTAGGQSVSHPSSGPVVLGLRGTA